MAETMTSGVHHVGLSVGRLEATAGFFTGVLGWQEVRRDPVHPAVFVSDGQVMISLWGLPEARAFDFRAAVGLHHLALQVASEAALQAVYQRLSQAPDVRIEFAPEQLRQGPARHMMCYEPSGIRLEFIWPG